MKGPIRVPGFSRLKQIQPNQRKGGYGNFDPDGKVYKPSFPIKSKTVYPLGETIEGIDGMAIVGTKLYASSFSSQIIEVDTLTGDMIVHDYLENVDGFCSIYYDGTYLWYGGGDVNSIVKVNLSTWQQTRYNHDSIDTILDFRFDGQYIWAMGIDAYLKLDPISGNSWKFTKPYSESIEFDGTNIWTTTSYVENPMLLKINISDGSYQEIPIEGLTERSFSIVFDGSFLWISDYDQIFKVNPQTLESVKYTIPLLNCQYPDSMIFANNFIWGLQYTSVENDWTSPLALVRIDPSNGKYEIYTMEQGEISGGSLAFDGTSIWIGTDDGSNNKLIKLKFI